MKAFFLISVVTLVSCISSIKTEAGAIVYDMGQTFTACGSIDVTKDPAAAVAGDVQCDKCVTVKRHNGEQVKIPIKHKCNDCDGKRVKLSKVAYEQVGGVTDNPFTREINGEWSIGGC